jgi:antibiotic biosynthesis monooxygenase (ABM) superfamily enzyme
VIFGIIAGIINAAVSIAATGTVLPVAGIGLGILAIILYPIFYFVIGFISTLFAAWLYNKLVPKIGAIKVTLSK